MLFSSFFLGHYYFLSSCFFCYFHNLPNSQELNFSKEKQNTKSLVIEKIRSKNLHQKREFNLTILKKKEKKKKDFLKQQQKQQERLGVNKRRCE